VVSRWTGVPVTKLMESEVGKLLHLDDELQTSAWWARMSGLGRLRAVAARPQAA